MDWIKDVVTAIALLGTGGVVGSWIHEWRRNRREDRLRWHAERRAAYERFLTGAEKMRDTELVIAEHVGNLRQMTEWGQDPLFDEEHLLRQGEKLDEEWAPYVIGKVRSERPVANAARDHVAGALAAMEMIPDPSVVDAARAYHDALHALVNTAANYPPRECGGWSEPLVTASQTVETARAAFITATRKELGVE
jgi:hypothetical protein